MTWLTYRSGILTERFQRRHLIINYSFLALILFFYLVDLVPREAISQACIPGALIFLISIYASTWKKTTEGQMGAGLHLP